MELETKVETLEKLRKDIISTVSQGGELQVIQEEDHRQLNTVKKERNLPYSGSHQNMLMISNRTLTVGGVDSHQTFAGGASKSYQSLDSDSSLATKENIIDFPLLSKAKPHIS